jgi:hypothetical protein
MPSVVDDARDEALDGHAAWSEALTVYGCESSGEVRYPAGSAERDAAHWDRTTGSGCARGVPSVPKLTVCFDGQWVQEAGHA